MLKHLMVEIYNGCNYRCNMCTIWQNKGVNVDLALLEKFLSSQYGAQMESIGITGGEPMMSNQLPQLAEVINRRPNIQTVYITSNGWFPDRLLDFVGRFKKKVCVNISIDGLKETHNKIRGIEAFDKAMGTINALKKSGLLTSLGIKMTVQESNVDEILDVYALSKKLGISFGLMPVVSTDAYFKNVEHLKGIRINPGTPQGEKLLGVLKKLRKQWHTPYVDMLIELYSGEGRNMDVYGCLFPVENNMMYADGTLGLCFMTGRRDVAQYLQQFEDFEKRNPRFRIEVKEDLLHQDCEQCPASCAANYKVPLPKRILNRLQAQLL